MGEGEGVRGVYRRLCGNPELEGLSGTPLGRPMAPKGEAGVLESSLALARGRSGVELASGGWECSLGGYQRRTGKLPKPKG